MRVPHHGPSRFDGIAARSSGAPIHRQGFLYGFHGRQETRPALRAVALASGEVAWSEARSGAGSLTLAGERLLVLREDGVLVLAEATPDAYRELSRAPNPRSTVRAHPAVAGGIFYARDGDTLVAVDLRRPTDRAGSRSPR